MVHGTDQDDVNLTGPVHAGDELEFDVAGLARTSDE
jgi:hypothetical protein